MNKNKWYTNQVINSMKSDLEDLVDLAEQITTVIETGRYGLYHATSQGDCTWYEFAVEIFRQSGLSPNLGRAKTGDFGEKATRPAYSVLENRALQQLGLDLMRPWQEALQAYLQERKTKNESQIIRLLRNGFVS